jgi:23S rRNA pseudouridine2605 synthase
MDDELGRKCVAALVADVGQRVYPIGRLDKNSEGLLLLTNDGALANALMHPTHAIPKIYRVTVRPGIKDEQITALMTGVLIDGKTTAPADVRVVTRSRTVWSSRSFCAKAEIGKFEKCVKRLI